MDLSGIDFVDITDLAPLYVMDDLTDLWLVDTQNLDAVDLDVLLDNLDTIEGTDVEGILYMTQADFDAFNTAGGGLLAAWHAEPGHHVDIRYHPRAGWRRPMRPRGFGFACLPSSPAAEVVNRLGTLFAQVAPLANHTQEYVLMKTTCTMTVVFASCLSGRRHSKRTDFSDRRHDNV